MKHALVSQAKSQVTLSVADRQKPSALWRYGALTVFMLGGCLSFSTCTLLRGDCTPGGARICASSQVCHSVGGGGGLCGPPCTFEGQPGTPCDDGQLCLGGACLYASDLDGGFPLFDGGGDGDGDAGVDAGGDGDGDAGGDAGENDAGNDAGAVLPSVNIEVAGNAINAGDDVSVTLTVVKVSICEIVNVDGDVVLQSVNAFVGGAATVQLSGIDIDVVIRADCTTDDAAAISSNTEAITVARFTQDFAADDTIVDADAAVAFTWAGEHLGDCTVSINGANAAPATSPLAVNVPAGETEYALECEGAGGDGLSSSITMYGLSIDSFTANALTSVTVPWGTEITLAWTTAGFQNCVVKFNDVDVAGISGVSGVAVPYDVDDDGELTLSCTRGVEERTAVVEVEATVVITMFEGFLAANVYTLRWSAEETDDVAMPCTLYGAVSVAADGTNAPAPKPDGDVGEYSIECLGDGTDSDETEFSTFWGPLDVSSNLDWTLTSASSADGVQETTDRVALTGLITDVTPLSNLRRIHDRLTVQNSAISDLSVMSSLEFVGENLVIQGNTQFSDAHAQTFASGISVTGTTTIQNNTGP